MKVLVAEPLAPAAIELLHAQTGWEIVIADPKTYRPHLRLRCAAGAQCGEGRQDVLGAAPKLRVIGRAGVGVDNVDLPAATDAGVL